MLMIAVRCISSEEYALRSAGKLSRLLGKPIAVTSKNETHHFLVHPTVFERYEEALPEIEEIERERGTREDVYVMDNESEGFITRDAYIVKLEQQLYARKASPDLLATYTRQVGP